MRELDARFVYDHPAKGTWKAIKQGKTLGRWIEDAIEEKLAREKTEEKHS